MEYYQIVKTVKYFYLKITFFHTYLIFLKNYALKYEQCIYLYLENETAAFLFKQAKDMNQDSFDETQTEHQRQTRMKMLITWVPFLCRSSNGTDAPILTLAEKVEVEKVLEEMIEMLEKEDEQEQVLSQWLHHFMYCPSSDWPNLQSSYSRWCTASRRILLAK